MSEKRKKYDREFREGAVRIVEETNKPIAQVARDLGVNQGTLGNWVKLARESRDGSSSLSKDDYAELQRLRGEVGELRMERDVLKRYELANYYPTSRAPPGTTLLVGLDITGISAFR